MNNITLVGNLVGDIRLNEDNTLGYITVAMANHKNADNKPDYADLKVFVNKGTKNLIPYLTKGKQVAITARFQSSSYVNKDGEKRFETSVVADNIQLLNSPKKIEDTK